MTGGSEGISWLSWLSRLIGQGETERSEVSA